MSRDQGGNRRFNRRDLLKGAAGIGVGAFAAAAFPSDGVSVIATRSERNPRGKARSEDVVDRSGSDFAAGKAGGAHISGTAAEATIRGVSGSVFESRAIPAPLAPTHLGLHWKCRGARPSDVLVAVRGGGNGQSWSAWQQVDIEAVAGLDGSEVAVPVHGQAPADWDFGSGHLEVFASLVRVEQPAFLQYRISFLADRQIEIDQVTITAIDSSGGSGRDASSMFATAQASEHTEVTLQNEAGIAINVITREGWGADEDLGFDESGEPKWEERFVPVKKVFVHHTATSNNYSDGAAEVSAIHAYHAGTLGWGDIGYQVLVDRFGNIYEGRRGRNGETFREYLSNGVEGGHIFAYNFGTTGIAALGNSDQGQWNRRWTDAGYEALVDAVTFECGRHFLDPEGESEFLRSDHVWHQGTLAHCAGHQDADGDGGATACPGRRLYDFLNSELRGRVASRLSDAVAPPSDLTVDRVENSLEFDWNGTENDEFRYFLEGWRRWVDEDDTSHMEYLTDHSTDFADESWTGVNSPGAGWSGDQTIESSIGLDLQQQGHYTLHVRPAGVDFGYADHVTVLVETIDDPGDPEEPITGSISGAVADEDGSLIEGATVSIEGTDQSATTDESGAYTFDDLEAGTYEVTAEADGYEPDTRTVDVEEGETALVDFSLTAESDDGGGNGDDEADSLVVAGLEGSTNRSGPDWTATVAIIVLDNFDDPVSGASISAEWSGGYQGAASGTTDETGTCQVSTGSISNRDKTVTLAISTLDHDSLEFDQNGSEMSITVER